MPSIRRRAFVQAGAAGAAAEASHRMAPNVLFVLLY